MADDLKLRVLLQLQDQALCPLQRIARGNKQLEAGLAATQTQLDKLSAQQSALTSLSRLQGQYKKSSNAVSVARAQLTLLQTQLPVTAKEQRAHASVVQRAEVTLGKTLTLQESANAPRPCIDLAP